MSKSVDDMVNWFMNNYEDPANGVPHESSEGGYQYINGGPYEAEEELREKFPTASDRSTEEAVARINAEGDGWVKKGQY